MFTGIIEEKGKVKTIQHGAGSARLTITAPWIVKDVKTGDSISVNGICLTVVTFDTSGFTVEVMPETIRRTNLNALLAGSHVNLERAVRLNDRLGGHMVSGHIDGTGKVVRRWEEENAIWFCIAAEPSVLRYIVEKGSVALDGISLTVVSVNQHAFEVSVIPHTSKATTILDRQHGDLLNIECDMIAKYVEKLCSARTEPAKIDMKFLEENDFIA